MQSDDIMVVNEARLHRCNLQFFTVVDKDFQNVFLNDVYFSPPNQTNLQNHYQTLFSVIDFQNKRTSALTLIALALLSGVSAKIKTKAWSYRGAPIRGTT